MSTPRVPQRCNHKVEYTRWRLDKDGPREFGPQPLAEELLGEHHLMDMVFDAMVAEARRCEEGAEPQIPFWQDAVDFLGSFVYRHHLAKEQKFFFPVLVRNRVLDRNPTIDQEHREYRELTKEIHDAFMARQWQRLCQLVPSYVIFMRRHMQNEECDLLQPYARVLSRKVHDIVIAGFRKVEQKTMNVRGRDDFIELARRLCRMAGMSTASL